MILWENFISSISYKSQKQINRDAYVWQIFELIYILNY